MAHKISTTPLATSPTNDKTTTAHCQPTASPTNNEQRTANNKQPLPTTKKQQHTHGDQRRRTTRSRIDWIAHCQAHRDEEGGEGGGHHIQGDEAPTKTGKGRLQVQNGKEGTQTTEVEGQGRAVRRATRPIPGDARPTGQGRSDNRGRLPPSRRTLHSMWREAHTSSDDRRVLGVQCNPCQAQ